MAARRPAADSTAAAHHLVRGDRRRVAAAPDRVQKTPNEMYKSTGNV
jgi:hypothetical protein